MAVTIRCPIDGLALSNMTWTVRDALRVPLTGPGDYAHLDGVNTSCPNGHTWALTLHCERTA